MTHFFAVMLWVAALLALVAGMPQLAIAIVVVVLLNGIFAFVLEYRADRAGGRLADLLSASPNRARGAGPPAKAAGSGTGAAGESRWSSAAASPCSVAVRSPVAD